MKTQASTVGILSLTVLLNALMLVVFFIPLYADNDPIDIPTEPVFETCVVDYKTPELRPPAIVIPQKWTKKTEMATVITPEPIEDEPLLVSQIVERPKRLDIPLSADIQDYIYNTCQTYNVPFELVIAMMKEESLFRADIISRTNDYGLMQINAINHDWLKEKLGIDNLLDPKQNALAGIYILHLHMVYCHNDVVKALMCYGLGANGAKKLWDKGIYTTAFVEKMLNIYGEYLEESHNYD